MYLKRTGEEGLQKVGPTWKNLLGLGSSKDETSGSEGGDGVVVGGREEASEDEEAEEDEETGKEEGVVDGSERTGLRRGGGADLLRSFLGILLLLGILLIQRRVGLRAGSKQALVHADLRVAVRDEQQSDRDQGDHSEQGVVLNALQLMDRVEKIYTQWINPDDMRWQRVLIT